MFENMGLVVDFETGYRVRPPRKPRPDAPDDYWIHDVLMRTETGRDVNLAETGVRFQDAFVAVWMKRVENDGFNKLVFTISADWKDVDLLRGLAAYRRQSGMDPAAPSQIRALNAYPAITQNVLHLFKTLFDPSSDETLAAREAAGAMIRSQIREQLSQVPSLEDDRVLRRMTNLIFAIQRTNFYQPERTCPLAFKIASRDLEDLPKPKPFREIFVASPVVEGVHIRFGPVARGGLRWSDRQDDFRTEVLGLVKAQQVKNAVIVPVGSKGGFVPKRLPPEGGREAIRDAGINAYRAFISALLSVTDNLIDGEVRHPDQTIARDGTDPYLVVAADKGTATFSDIANEISVCLGFWLGDAFASGGSAGYDHKAMGITARGAWEAVKRHFHEMGKDIQSEPFTVIGVGDMSGDVFGNGMLLSEKIQLKAAFNHLHIFVDPDPIDTDRCFAERQRLFDLPRSSWSEYDVALISEGGGVFERSAKAIPLSQQMKDMAGLTADEVTPDELIHALLKSEAELLWFGGIGTYVKSDAETSADVGDRANDAIRVNADELKVKVIGEGANLGITQSGRIAFALNGGRVNTDAIDNSAGVDSSDHEVNIKILLSEAMRRGQLPRGERNTLLASMTDDVARHVLTHNTSQTGALSLAEASAAEDHFALERLMVRLERRGVLDRDVEGLPSTEDMASRAEAGQWLTRPEIAVLLAWSKIVLFDDIVASDLPDDPVFVPVLKSYFPTALNQYADTMLAHRLHREIIATVLSNRIIDFGGPAMMLELREVTGAQNADIVKAFEVALSAAKSADIRAMAVESGVILPADVELILRRAHVTFIKAATAQIVRTQMDGETLNLIARYQKGFDALI
ncbi:MAG: NAD-glutamate dehydrogenase domain-containing protein, partial [Pseudomonadota bacterium]